MIDLDEMNDMEKADNLYQQISEFGQTPFQLFKTNGHPEKKVIKSQKRLHELALRIECSCILKNHTPIIYFYQSSGDQFKIILKNNDVVEYEQSISHFCFNINVDDSPMKPLNYQQIYVLKKNPSILIIGGYPDNSFKIHNNQKEKASCYFHRKIISCLDVSENLGLIVCGSKDFRISLWSMEMKNFSLNSTHPIHIFYGHQNQVITLVINECLEIVASVDKNNRCLVHSLKSKKYLNKIDLKIDDNDVVKLISLHENGLILFASKKNMVLLYKYLFPIKSIVLKFLYLVLTEICLKKKQTS
jgi:WD40 repeat protein